MEGLQWCLEMQFNRIEVEVDAQDLVDVILHNEEVHGGATTLRTIKEMAAKQWELSFRFIYREVNRCADLMASLGKS